MRTPLLAGLIAVLVPACMDGLTGVGGDDGTQTGATCGNGVMESGETCDDSNTTGGDGCSATCQTESSSPRVNVTVDKPTVMTELNTANKITVTVTGSGGFTGNVALAGSIVDSAMAPITAWQVSFDNATVTLAQNGTATAVATVTIPSENKALAGTLKIDATSTSDPATASSAITALNQITFAVKDNGSGLCAYPTNQALNVTFGTKLRFVNTDVSTLFQIHVNGVDSGGNSNGTDATSTFGIPHENTQGTGEAIGAAYEGVLTKTNTANVGLSWYCHLPGPSRSTLLIKPVN